MDKIATILVPFDFSDASHRALDYAVNYAGNRANMHIIMLHVAPASLAEEANRKFKAVRAGYGPRLKPELSWEIREEALTESILRANRQHKADLIVMGTYGAKADEQHTHTSELVARANCPVLVIPGEPREFRVKNIALVLGRDEIETAEDLGILLDVARMFNARVHVLTIENEPGTYGYSQSEEKNEVLLDYYLEDFYADHVYIENKDVFEGISQYVEEKEIDIIAILPRNHSKTGEPSQGRLTEILTLRSRTPVLAID
jgi:nucleotide-binding universal stress UspA family protein